MRPPKLLPVVLLALSLVAAACGNDGDGAPEQATPEAPTLTISSPAPDDKIGGNVVELNLAARGIEIKNPDGDTSGKTGHFHVFIDRDPVAVGEPIPREPGIVHSAENPVLITGLSPGKHKLTVVLGDGAHTRVTKAAPNVSVEVEGPSIDATAPATATAGQPVTVDVNVQGVQLRAAADDIPPSTETGHLHAFVDVDPSTVEPGLAIPREEGKIFHFAEPRFTTPPLTAGEHTIWFVLGNGAHVAFDPRVMDKVTITVT